MLTGVLTPRIPRLTASRHGFLARSTALSWPWNRDRILAPPGTLPPSFTDVALGLVDRTRPVIQVWCKDPLQREKAFAGTAAPVTLAQAKAQGATTHPAAEQPARDPRFREDDDEGVVSAQNPVHRERTGPLRNGNPRGNPNLAPRCGARARRTGCPCRAPAMRNGRCRLHGGKSTGPRTEEGRARIRAARTRHGLYSADGRAFQRDITGLLRRNRQLLSLASQPGPGNAVLDAAALCHLLSPDLGKNLLQRETALPSGARSIPLTWQDPMQRETAAPPPSTPSVTPAKAGDQGLSLRIQSESPSPALAPLPPRWREDNRDGSQTGLRENPMQREAAAPYARTAWRDPLQREKSHARPTDQPPTTPVRRPILLARPTAVPS